MKKASDDEFARAFACLVEVQQNGEFRPATPNDLLELLAPRYLLKGARGYLADDGKGWTARQSEAIQAPDRETAYEGKRTGLDEFGVAVKVVRLRRKGTMGVNALRLRKGLGVTQMEQFVGLDVNGADAMQILAALSGAKVEGGKQ